MSADGAGAGADAGSGAAPEPAQEVRTRLEGELDRLRSALAGLDRTDDDSESGSVGELSSADQHPADLGTETQQREQDGAIAESIHAEIGDVDAALRRLDEGTYGICVACGRPIGADRLVALPATPYCVEDASRAEREAIGGTALPEA